MKELKKFIDKQIKSYIALYLVELGFARDSEIDYLEDWCKNLGKRLAVIENTILKG